MSLVLTMMQSLRAQYAPGTLDKNEIRASRYGAWDFFQKQTAKPSSVMTSQVRELIKKSTGNTVNVPVLDAEEVTIGTARTCTVQDSENTSKLVTLTFVPYSFGFTMTPAQHYNNDVDYQADFDRKMRKYLLKFASILDTSARNTLEVNRNQYFPSELTTYYPNVGNALQVAQSEKEDFFNNLESIHQTMDYYEKMNIVASTSLGAYVRKLDSNGANNAINTAYQLDPYAWNFSNRITNGAGVQSTLYAVPDGYVAVENRNAIDNIKKSRIGTIKEWDEAVMPIVNLKMGTYYYEDCADRSSLNASTTHLTATKLEGFQFSTDIVYMTAYNSAPTTRYSPILKTEISAT